jgi:hypothetical protein
MSLLIALVFVFTQNQSALPVERNGYVEVEAEDFVEQANNRERTWYVLDGSSSGHKADPDSLEYQTASGGKFVELLPDTRVTHDDELIHGTNFSNKPGLSVLKYKVRIQNPGKYYVWVRAYSTGTEDNGIHVGIDGEWPESGQRMQWCDGKNQWTWESKQRTEENHCGEPRLIFLEIDKPGVHTIMFSMREDGFAFDKFALSKKYEKPE